MTASISVKIAVVPPMPMARVRTAATVNAGASLNWRTAYLTCSSTPPWTGGGSEEFTATDYTENHGRKRRSVRSVCSVATDYTENHGRKRRSVRSVCSVATDYTENHGRKRRSVRSVFRGHGLHGKPRKKTSFRALRVF